jgi:beta-glucosidase
LDVDLTILQLNQLEALANFGIGTSIYQISAPELHDLGDEPNQWDIFSKKYKTVPSSTTKVSAWETIEHYLPILAEMGFKQLRLSVEWNFIEPSPGQFNLAALEKYRLIAQRCIALGLEPMFTLYHFTQPEWFMKKGGFEREENILLFINYCKTVINYLKMDVKWWCSMNEPAVEAFAGYWLGIFPPHRYLNFNRAALILLNLLKAHTELFNLYKDDTKLHIGLVHNVLHFESSYKILNQLFARPISIFTNELVWQYLEQGRFNYMGLKHLDTRPKANCSYVNIYGSVQLGLFGPTCQTHQTMGDMHIALYPESYAFALEHAARLDLPIYVTETGIADAKDNLRPQFIIDFLRVVLDKIEQGMDIRGLYFWTFKDNYEWHQGNTISFGLFNQQNMPRQSAFLFQWIMTQFQQILKSTNDTHLILEQWRKQLNYAETKIKQNDFNDFLQKK